MTKLSTPHDVAISDHMTITDVMAHYRDASKRWVYQSVARGILPPFYKVGGRTFWSRSEIEKRDAKRRLAEQEAA